MKEIANNHRRILIIGGGVSGIALARHFSDIDSNSVTLIEKTERLGGVYRDYLVDDISLDIGAFIFLGGSPLFKLAPFIEKYFTKINYRPGRFHDSNTYDDYPIDLKDLFSGLSMLEWGQIGADIAISKLRFWSKETAEAYIKYYLGSRLYKRSGLSIYIFRLFNLPPNQVDASFPEQRMSFLRNKLSIRKMLQKISVKDTPIPSGDGLIKKSGYLARTEASFEEIFKNVERALTSRGVVLHYRDAIQRIVKKNGVFVVETERLFSEFDEIYSTGALDEQHKAVFGGEVRLAQLDLISVFLRAEGRPNCNYNVVFNFRSIGAWKRATFRTVGDREDLRTYVVVETTVQSADLVRARALMTEVLFDFNQNNIGEMDSAFEAVGFCITPNAYPRYSRENVTKTKQMLKELEDFGIKSFGRQGKFSYIPSASKAVGDIIRAAHDKKI